MSIALKIIMLVSSVVIIISVMLQESRSDGLSGVIGGGAEQLFGRKKSRGYDVILHRITLAGVIVFFITAIISLYV